MCATRGEEVFNEEPETSKEEQAEMEIEDDMAGFLKVEEGVQEREEKRNNAVNYLEYLFVKV